MLKCLQPIKDHYSISLFDLIKNITIAAKEYEIIQIWISVENFSVILSQFAFGFLANRNKL